MAHVLPITCRARCIPQPAWICRTSAASWRRYLLRPSQTSRWSTKDAAPKQPAYATSRIFTNSAPRSKRQRNTPPPPPAKPRAAANLPPLIQPSAATLLEIFGPELSEATALAIINKLQFRRTNGSLIEKGVYFPEITEEVGLKALAWLREQHPMDEEANAQEWLDRELEAAESEMVRQQEEELTERAQRMGIYRVEEPEPEEELSEKHGREMSVLEAIRAKNEAKWEREQEERKRKEEEENRKNIEEGRSTSLAQHQEQQLSFWEAVKRPNAEKEARKQKYYEDAILTTDTEAPKASMAQRLLPSTILAGLITAGSLAFAYYYEPALPSERLFPDVPPSAVTLLPIIGLNALIWVAWKRPELWRVLNKYFVDVPGAPRAPSVILNTFSHQRFFHLAGNMFILWHFGTQLHDATNRGFVLPLYLSAGVLSSLGCLYFYTLRSRFNIFSMGASGAVFAVFSAFHMLDPHAKFVIPVEGMFKEPGAYPGWAILAATVTVDQLLGFWLKSVNTAAHLGGVIVGVAGVWVWKDLWGRKSRVQEVRRLNR